MRSALVLVCCATWLGLAGCSGGYPLPPTRCDEWCDATKGRICQEYYDPAGCVSQCEKFLDVDMCRTQFDAVITCYRASKRVLTQACTYDSVPNDCELELQDFDTCLAASYGYPGFR